MNTNAIRLVAGIAWAGLAVASAAPANALAYTEQSGGSFASCSASYSSLVVYACWGEYIFVTNYVQQIKFVTTACSTGGCNSDNGEVYTDIVYPTGRKMVSQQFICEQTRFIYELGACGC